MSLHPCKFVRKNGSGYEYGHLHIEEKATPREKRTHVVVGKAPSYQAALDANAMAHRGQPRIGINPSDLPWRN